MRDLAAEIASISVEKPLFPLLKSKYVLQGLRRANAHSVTIGASPRRNALDLECERAFMLGHLTLSSTPDP
jgi:hypothetical protein